MPAHSRQELDPASLPAEIRDLLARRAERMRVAPEADAGEEELLWVGQFPIGVEQHAIPLASLRAALPLRLVTPVPLAPPPVIGVLRYQGRIVTALSLASL